jgi:hypothetical protein
MLNPEEIAEIEELATCFFTEEEICEITGIKEPCREFKKAMRKGHLQSEYKLRKSIIDLAQDGSSPAQSLAVKMLETLKRKEY